MHTLDAGDLAPLIEALEHGRDGQPRWIVTAAERGRVITDAVASITAAATQRGFVAVPVDRYLRARIIDSRPLDHRTLMLVDTDCDPSSAHSALLHASTQSPRPHVLLTVRAAATTRTSNMQVREARAAYAASVDHADSPQVADLVRRASRAPELVARGRHAAAERLLREVRSACARRGADRQAARVTIALGRLLIDRGRVRPAIEALEDAVAAAQAARCDELIVEARLWQGMARIVAAAFVEAEAISRAVLEAPRLGTTHRLWAQAILTDALCRQGRACDVPEFSLEDATGLEAGLLATIHEIRAQWLLARGRLFEAGCAVETLRAIAAGTNDDEARVIAVHVELQVQAATGDLARIKQTRDSAIAAARAARMPFRIAAARLIWIDAARRAGRSDDIAACVESLRRVCRVAPPLLQHEIERRLTPDTRASSVRARVEPVVTHASLPAALLRLAYEEDDDLKALENVLARISDQLQTARIDVQSNAAGPGTLICSAGQGLPTRLGTRVLDAGFAIGPERQAGGWELGLPVRIGSRTLGALISRWPLDRDVPPDAAELLEVAAVIAAPRVDALQSAAREATQASTAVPELLGVSDAIAIVRRGIVRAAAAPFNVLIEGETGVGKELAARAVHHLSARRERRFCDLNCAALPEELLESELFGHVRGAFSGAVADRSGLFEDANGGTLFLDEVADLSSRAQAKLLRVVQQQEVRRVGESFSRSIDVRLVAAANRDMRAEAAAGRFRSDLLYRLDVVRIQIPPLRDRIADIPVLAEHCWNAVTRRTGSKARLSAATLNELSRYHWPGNVREMQNVIASLALAAPARGWVRPAALPSVIGAATTVSSGRLSEARQQFERRFVEVALARAAGNRTRAARSLGISRQGLLKILVRLGLDGPSCEAESC